MKKTTLFLIISLVGAVVKLAAQDVYFCSSYTDKGQPSDASKSFTLGKNGGYVYILFSNHKKHIKAKSLVLQLMKKSGSEYHKYEKRAMELHPDNNWAVLDYQFTEEGDYEAVVQDKTGKELSSGFVEIKLAGKQEDSIASSQKNGADPGRNYYHAKIIFYRSILNGIPTDSGSIFPTGEVNVVIRNDKPLATDSMIVDVFKKGYESEKYPIYISSKNLKIDNASFEASFPLLFDQTGQYKVVIYNSQSQAIATGYITIR